MLVRMSILPILAVLRKLLGLLLRKDEPSERKIDEEVEIGGIHDGTGSHVGEFIVASSGSVLSTTIDIEIDTSTNNISSHNEL